MRLLDLFCGAGGAAMGYHRAGFEVVGVDIQPQPHYPFEFHQADALEYVAEHGREFDVIHASPPCQDHMRVGQHPSHGTGWMLAATRTLLAELPSPWVIENVPGAPMRADFLLCGCQFGLLLRRERWFETSWHGFQLMPPHDHSGPPVVSVVGHGTPTWVRDRWIEVFGHSPKIADYREAMGIDWMNRDELSQAIPPAYTEWIGRQLIEALPSPTKETT